MTRAFDPSASRPVRARRYARKGNSLVLAAQALAKGPMNHVTLVQAAPDIRSKWHLFASTHGLASARPILTPEYSIHFVTGSRAKRELEATRISSFYSYLGHAGVHPRVIVSGTTQGPDIMLRLHDGNLAIVEVRGQRGHISMAQVLSSRYSYLLDHFKLFCAMQNERGHWSLYRFQDNTFEPAEPEVLSG